MIIAGSRLKSEFHHHVSGAIKMAASFLNKVAALGLGAAVVGGVVNTALYNGKREPVYLGYMLLKYNLILYRSEDTNSLQSRAKSAHATARVSIDQHAICKTSKLM